MDCNREEAIRAKNIAEKKMQSKDFLGARKIALKAKQLYPDVENISQMLIVCDVHCSAAKKLAGDDVDWYGILQVERTADEATIKKQYKKFALQLHPDKNKFSGAEGAFKLIEEAQRMLLDKEKRRQHDMKHGSGLYRPPHTTNWNVNMFPNTNRSHSSVPHSQNMQSQQPAYSGYPDPKLTFWTCCPFCSVKYQYYKEIMNRSLRCQNCQKPFVAYDTFAPSAPKFTKPVFPEPNSTYKVEVRVQQNFGTGNSRTAPVQNAGNRSTPDVGTGKVNRGREKKRVRKRNQISDSEPSDSDSNSDSEEEEEVEVDENGDLKGGQNLSHLGDQNVRRSSRRKQQVSYKENLSDDDYSDEDNDQVLKKAKGKKSSVPSEENRSAAKDESAKGKGQSHFVAETDKDDNEVKLEESDEKEGFINGDEAGEREAYKSPDDQPMNSIEDQDDADSSSESEEQSLESLFSYPDPNFSNFEKDRSKECFSAGQMWAAYDDQGAMPRFYVMIKKVLLPAFRMKITWLEPDPDDAIACKWHCADLPFSCGKFKYGTSDVIDKIHMFSHQIGWANGSRKDTFVIHPRKGETWAIFKNWDTKWICDPAAIRKKDYEFEFVEILSDYVDSVGIHVALLSKVDGFVSLYSRTVNIGKRTLLIPPGELLRFSHMIPSRVMTGKEGEGVPAESFELDPASLPLNLLSSSIPDHKSKPMMGCDAKNSNSRPHPNSSSAATASVPEDVLESEFYNFDAAKSEDKFQVGQIWALYSDEDGYPKYYCQIEKIDKYPAFKVHVSWLCCSGLRNAARRCNPEIPICCGRFKIGRKACQAYDSNRSFSHQVRAVPLAAKKNEYIILPRKGEVWALYRSWTADMKLSDLENCVYDIVEVVSEEDLQIIVLGLEPVGKFNAVFKPRAQELISQRSISKAELQRFSHQIPAFRLTKEQGGTLQGFWELDPAALPVHRVCSK